MKRARGVHIVIRGLGWKQREDRGSKMASGRSLYNRCFPACNYLPRLAHSSLARSLAHSFAASRPFARVLPLPPRTWPTSQSLARSLARPSIYAPSSFLPQCSRTGCVRRGPEFHGKSLGYIFTSGAIKAVGVRPFLD